MRDNNDKTIYRVSVDECKKLCWTYSIFICKSFDYRKSDRSCYLSKRAAYDRGMRLGSSSNYDYYEKQNVVYRAPINLANQFKERSRTYLSGNNDKKVISNIDGCKKACLTETSFVCKSFDYYTPGKYCNLSKKERFDNVSMGSSSDYTYFEKQNNLTVATTNSTNKFTSTARTYLSNNNDKKLNTNLEGCKRACLTETDFHCKSFDFNAGEKWIEVRWVPAGNSWHPATD